jgi:hypothetical protein
VSVSISILYEKSQKTFWKLGALQPGMQLTVLPLYRLCVIIYSIYIVINSYDIYIYFHYLLLLICSLQLPVIFLLVLIYWHYYLFSTIESRCYY